MQQVYTYNATLIKVIDGDTLDVRIDLGFRIAIEQRIRITGINAPELRGVDRLSAQASKLHLQKLLDTLPTETQPLQVITHNLRTDAWGRLLATIRAGGRDVGFEQLRAGHAVRA